jgi:hypothetical protein
VGSAGFEPAASSAQGWHHTKLDNDPAAKTIFTQHTTHQHNFKFLQAIKNLSDQSNISDKYMLDRVDVHSLTPDHPWTNKVKIASLMDSE